MWFAGFTVGLSALLFAGTLRALWPGWSKAPYPWRVLAGSGIPLALAGLIFVVRFWNPTPGPYLANVRYPFGSYLDAWAVSFGFAWLAFGLVFFLAASVAPRTRRVWFALVVVWCLVWLPHVMIGLTAATAGDNDRSLAVYTRWASTPVGRLILVSNAVILFVHFGLSLVGFGLVARSLRRHDAEARRSDEFR